MASMEQVTELINDCWAYFKTTSLQPKTVKSWADELSYMDIWNAGGYIRHKFKQADAFPANFPKTIKGIYHEWVRQQPKAVGTTDKGCQYCMLDEGLIHAIKEFHGYPYVFAFRCGHCNTSDLNYPTATREWLFANGYRLDWQHDFTGGINKSIVKKYIENQPLDEIPF